MRHIDLSLFSPYENLFLTDELLSKYAFSLCGGPCPGLIKVENSQMLESVIKCCITAGYPYKVLGGMTNILISDKGLCQRLCRDALHRLRSHICIHKHPPDIRFLISFRRKSAVRIAIIISQYRRLVNHFFRQRI